MFEGCHGDLSGIGFASYLDGSHEALECQLDQAIGVACNPVGTCQWREARIRQSLAIGLVTSDAVSFATENLCSLDEEPCILCREVFGYSYLGAIGGGRGGSVLEYSLGEVEGLLVGLVDALSLSCRQDLQPDSFA